MNLRVDPTRLPAIQQNGSDDAWGRICRRLRAEVGEEAFLSWFGRLEVERIATAELAIRDLISQRAPKRVKIDEIQRLVASHYNVCREDILSARRTANVVRPRQIAMYLSKVLTLRSLPEIGRRFGGRDHTTVLHAVRKIEELCGLDALVGAEVKTLRALLLEC